jgi:pyruvate,water dikinase
LVGGKNASLGELYSVLSEQGVRVPNGFALTAEAYRNALSEAGAWDGLRQLLDRVDKRRIERMAALASCSELNTQARLISTVQTNSCFPHGSKSAR